MPVLSYPVLFSLNASSQYAQYFWDFGDGSPGVSTLDPSVTHTYTNPGPKYVTLTVTDVCGGGYEVWDTFVDVSLPQFPGTNDDWRFFTGVNGVIDTSDFRIVFPNDVVSILYESPNGTYFNDPYYVFGNPVIGIPQPFLPVPGAWVDPLNPGFFPLIDGVTPIGPLPPAPILPGGNLHSFLVPPGLSGQDLMLQALVISPQAGNGIFGTSDAKVIQFR
ncbi:MAG: hypothetical protein CMJ83_00950 [Planctomycetes bacterium]|nr:hypothetical protein [Planctomycetota bacterium]